MQKTLFGALLLLVLLDLTLVLSNGSLSVALKALERRAREAEEGRFDRELAVLRKELSGVSAERARLASNVERLDQLVDALRGTKAVVNDEAERHGEPDSPSFAAPMEASGGKRDPAEIPLLSEDEKQDLLRKREALPATRPGERPLLEGDVEALLKDPSWNPGNRTLSEEEKATLAALLGDYKYFARELHAARAEGLIKVEMAKMAQAGAYVEYAADDPRTLPPTVFAGDIPVFSASGAAEMPGLRRLYYFYPQDYPGLYHQRQVEQERSLECYVKVYEFLNGPLVPVVSGEVEVEEK